MKLPTGWKKRFATVVRHLAINVMEVEPKKDQAKPIAQLVVDKAKWLQAVVFLAFSEPVHNAMEQGR